MDPLVINYIVLVIGLILIGVFWIFLARRESDSRKKTVRRWVTTYFALGIVMFTIQYLTLGLG